VIGPLFGERLALAAARHIERLRHRHPGRPPVTPGQPILNVVILF
jgi:hypothetical protein